MVKPFKTGKEPFVPDDRDLRFSKYLKPGGGALASVGKVITPPIIPPPPEPVGNYKLVDRWQMLGNDRVGNCVIAGALHLVKLWSASTNRTLNLTEQLAINIYSEFTGYDPSNPATDRGANMRSFLKHWLATGLPDGDGGNHKIGAYVLLDPGDLEQLRAAIYLFGGVFTGVWLPEEAMEAFIKRQPWTVYPDDLNPGGGHCIIYGGKDIVYNYAVTWGDVHPTDDAFYKQYNEESYAVISPDMINDKGVTLEGFDLEQLRADLAYVKTL